ncbi:MAG: HEAT repeat domain-containing protein [Planctomycetota bacterium]
MNPLVPHPVPLARRRRPLVGVAAVGLLLALLVGAPSAAPPASAGDDPGLAAIRRRLEEPEPAERAAAVRRLAGALDPASLGVVVATLSDVHPYVRRAAAGVLGTILDPAARQRLLDRAPTLKDGEARAALTETFGAWADRDGRTGLLRACADRDPGVRAAAAERLADDPDEAAGRALLIATTDADGLVRAAAWTAITARARLAGATKVEVRGAEGLKDRDPRARVAALEGSVAAGGEAAVYAVTHGLDDAVWSVRLVAAESAGGVRERRVLAPLVAALKDPRERVAAAAGVALVRLTGIPFDADPERWGAWLAKEGATFDPAEVAARKPPPYDPGGRTAAVVKFLDVPLVSSHVAFVLDASGSMSERDAAGASRWDRVRDEVDRVLERVGGSVEGNVVVFSDAATALFPSAVRFTPTARDKVRAALLARPPAGRTALYDGIALALADPTIDQVIVLSDGAPSAGAWFTKTDLREGLARANRWRRARIDVIAVGADDVAKRWRTLLRDVAESTGGRFVAR